VGYREDLKSLSPNEVARHAKEAALAGEEEVRLRRELEENQRREMPCMVKYQDTAAYKATDEQLRHRDALEKSFRPCGRLQHIQYTTTFNQVSDASTVPDRSE
jgi:hypothetical protein